MSPAELEQLSVNEWAVEMARDNLRHFENMRADEECGPREVEQARDWLRLCLRVRSPQVSEPAEGTEGRDEPA